MISEGSNKKSVLRANGAFLVLCPFLLAVTVPFIWMVLGVFKTNDLFFRLPRFWPVKLFDGEYWNMIGKNIFPQKLDWQNFNGLLNGDWGPFWEVFGNSLMVSLAQAIGAVALSVMAGYAFARFTFRGRRVLFVFAVALILVPRQLFAVPLYTWVNTLGMMDNLMGVVLPGVVTGLGVIYFTQVFRQVPEEYLQAARVCGAPEFRVFLTVLPLLWPALLSFGMIHFILAWHEHMIPNLVLFSETNRTLPLALAKLYDTSQRTPQGVQMAASTFAVIPIAILFALCHRRFKSSISDLLVH